MTLACAGVARAPNTSFTEERMQILRMVAEGKISADVEIFVD